MLNQLGWLAGYRRFGLLGVVAALGWRNRNRIREYFDQFTRSRSEGRRSGVSPQRRSTSTVRRTAPSKLRRSQQHSSGSGHIKNNRRKKSA